MKEITVSNVTIETDVEIDLEDVMDAVCACDVVEYFSTKEILEELSVPLVVDYLMNNHSERTFNIINDKHPSFLPQYKNLCDYELGELMIEILNRLETLKQKQTNE